MVKLLIKEAGERRCAICNATEWMGKKLPVELDQVDGDSSNNDLSTFASPAAIATLKPRRSTAGTLRRQRQDWHGKQDSNLRDNWSTMASGQCDSLYAIPAE